MIMTVIAILKKHLDDAYEELDQWEGIEKSPYNVLQDYPNYHQLRRLAWELIGVIRGIDVSKLVQIPNQKETIVFLKSIMPTELITNDEFLAQDARELRIWLCGFRKWFDQDARKMRLYQASERKK